MKPAQTGIDVILQLAASSDARARDSYWRGVLDGVELVIDKAALDGGLSDDWLTEVRDFLAVAKEHC